MLVAGLGNAAITPDALGEKVIAQILATSVKRNWSVLQDIKVRSVKRVAQMYWEIQEWKQHRNFKGLTQQLRPKAVIVIDAMAARRFRKIGQNSANQYSRNCTGSRC